MRAGTTPDGAVQFLGWRDTQRNEDCSFTIVAGKMRCVPLYTILSTFFADSACRVSGAFVASSCTTPKYVASSSTATCGGVDRVFAAGPVTAGAYLLSGTTCNMAYSTTSGISIVAPGAEVPLTSFVEVTESIQ
jgi:hypothetical protein